MATPAERRDPMPSTTYRGVVIPEWIDANRHMNVSAYDGVFDAAERSFFDEFGLGNPYIARTGLSCFRLERCVRYERELVEGDAVEVRSRIAWTDFRKIHHFHELWNLGLGRRAAFADVLSIHVDLRSRSSVSIEYPEIRMPLVRLAEAHALLPTPSGMIHRSGSPEKAG